MYIVLKYVEFFLFLFNVEIRKGVVLFEVMFSEGINNMFCKKGK